MTQKANRALKKEDESWRVFKIALLAVCDVIVKQIIADTNLNALKSNIFFAKTLKCISNLLPSFQSEDWVLVFYKSVWVIICFSLQKFSSKENLYTTRTSIKRGQDKEYLNRADLEVTWKSAI